MREPVWVREDVVRAIHRRQLAEHGGREGLREPELLLRALAAPRQLFLNSIPTPDLGTLAAAYGIHLLDHRPFVDGNNRTALVVLHTFLRLNGADLVTSPSDSYLAVRRVAEGALSEAEFTQWLRGHLTPPPNAESLWKRRDLGGLLLEKRLISPEQLERARRVQQQTRQRDLLHVLADLVYLSEIVALQARAASQGLQYVDLAHFPVEPEAVHLLPHPIAARHGVLPIRMRDRLLTVATSHPGDVFAEDDVRLASGCRIHWVVATPEAIRAGIERYYGEAGLSPPENIRRQPMTETDAPTGRSQPVQRIADTIIHQALRDGAVEIHLIPGEDALRVYYLLDGRMTDQMKLPLKLHAELLSHLKDRAKLNRAETSRLQDGTMTVLYNDRSYRLPVRVLPTSNGEKLGISILRGL